MKGYYSLLLALLLLSGCCGLSYNQLYNAISNQPGINGNTPSNQAEWTYIVYMNANNNLEYGAVLDFFEMEQGGGSTDKVNVVVQFARSGDYNGGGNWNGTRRFLVKAGDGQSVHSQVVKDIGKVDMGNPDTLYNFVSWAIDKYPAKKYAVVLWDHGGGWTGLLEDDNSKTLMDLGKMRQVLGKIKQKLGRNIDVVIFNMCLMAQYDVMLDVHNYADYMVASEEEVPGYSFDYNRTIRALDANPTMNPKELSIMEVEKYREYWVGKQEATTLGAYDMSKVPELEQAFGAFAESLSNHVKNGGWMDMAEMHQYAEHYPQGVAEEKQFSFGDLYDFTSNAMAYSYNDSALAESAVALQVAINETTILNYNHVKHPRSYGVSYYFQPAKWIYDKYNANAYSKTTAYNQTAWSGLLTEYYKTENLGTTKPTISDFKVSASASLVRPIKFSYTMAGFNIVKNQWLQFYNENGEWKLARLIGQRTTTTLPNGKVVYGIPDGTSKDAGRSSPIEMTLGNGSISSKVSVEKRWPAEDVWVVNGHLQRGQDEVDAQISFYESNGSISQVQVSTPGPDGQPVVGYLPGLEYGDVFTPYVYTLNQQGLTPEKSQPLTYTGSLELEWHLLQPGTYMVADMLTDLTQQVGYSVGSVTVGKQPTLTPLEPQDLHKNWECGQIEQGLTVMYLASFNFSNECVMEDVDGVSSCELTYSDNAIPHMYIYMKDRFETLKFMASRINDSAIWLFDDGGNDPVICVTAGSAPPSTAVYKELYSSIGDDGADLEQRQVDAQGIRGEWESPENNMTLSLNNDGTFRWTVSSHAISGSYSVNVSHLSLNANSPSPDYSTVFRYIRGSNRMALYERLALHLYSTGKG
jgi:hypothetical protein